MLTGVRPRDRDRNLALWVISDPGGGDLDTLHARDRRGKKTSTRAQKSSTNIALSSPKG